MLTGYPLVQLALTLLFPALWHGYGVFITLAIVLGGLFVPIIWVGKKYE